MAFDPTYSSDLIWVGEDMDVCLTDELNDVKSDIEGLQISKADINHVHTQYAPLEHTHSEYSTISDMSQVQSQVANKVDKVDGKSLSSNDYTNVEKNKLSGIESGAQKNTITGIKGDVETIYRTGEVNITPANIGAALSSHTHNYAGSASAGGAATSATKLATARTIQTNLASTSSASFNGTANITPGVTGTLSVANGGTGATTASAARTKLGVTNYGAACSAKGSASSLDLSAMEITNVTLNTWNSRTDTAFTFSGGGIKCPYAGTVLISGSVYIRSGTVIQLGGCYVYKGNAEIASQYVAMGSGSVSSGVKIINVAAGDVIYLKARYDVTTTCVPNNCGTMLNIMYIK